VHLSVNIYCYGLKCVCRVSGISVLARAVGGGGGGVCECVCLVRGRQSLDYRGQCHVGLAQALR
jgi:hypothetical protein